MHCLDAGQKGRREKEREGEREREHRDILLCVREQSNLRD
jgi:hypothetical protein